MSLKLVDCLVEDFLLALTFLNLISHVLNGELSRHELFIMGLRTLVQLPHLQFQLFILTLYWIFLFRVATIYWKHTASTSFLVFTVFFLQEHCPLVQIDSCCF